MVYLSGTVAIIGVALLAGSLDLDLDETVREWLVRSLVVLTLPVSAAYFAVVFLLDSSGPPPQGGLRPTAVLFYLGFLALAVVNAGYVRHLRRTVPLAVLLSLPQWLVAGLAWCGISGCSGGGFGVSTGTEWLAVTMSVVNGLILAVAVFAVRWLYPTRRRALIALAAGTLFGLLGAAVTHG